MSWLNSNLEAWRKLKPLILHGPILNSYVVKRLQMFKEALGLSGCWWWLLKVWMNTLLSSSGSSKLRTSMWSSCALIKAGWSLASFFVFLWADLLVFLFSSFEKSLFWWAKGFSPSYSHIAITEKWNAIVWWLLGSHTQTNWKVKCTMCVGSFGSHP